MWINERIDGHEYWADVYDEGSVHGINGGRVLKLAVVAPAARKWIYYYDRGLDFDNAPDGLIDRILDEYQLW